MLSHNRIALTGIFASITIVLGVIDNMIPLPIPGIRLGLANIGIMLAIYALPFKETMYIALIKAILIPILTGNLFIKLLIGLPATMAATLAMYFYYSLTNRLSSPMSTGAIGALVHITVQFIVIKLTLIKTLAIYTILPYFSTLSIISGIITGYIVSIIIDNFKDRFKNSN